MEKVAIVILNYLNYKDTIECIESIKNDIYSDKELIIVDNNSHNESWDILYEKYNTNCKITLIRSNENLGFAKGNNLGIDYARNKLNCNFVLLVNNDTIFDDSNMITELMKSYEETVGVIGPRIIAANKIDQNPVFTNVSKEKIAEEFKYLKSTKYKIKNNNIYKLLRSNTILIRIKRKLFNKPQMTPKEINNQCSEELVLHGSCMLLTKCYFKYYTRLFPETFLYYEENILTLLTKKVGLKKKFIENVHIYHKEDQSSEMSFNNSDDVRLKYLLESMKICNDIYDMSYENIYNKYFIIN